MGEGPMFIVFSGEGAPIYCWSEAAFPETGASLHMLIPAPSAPFAPSATVI